MRACLSSNLVGAIWSEHTSGRYRSQCPGSRLLTTRPCARVATGSAPVDAAHGRRCGGRPPPAPADRVWGQHEPGCHQARRHERHVAGEPPVCPGNDLQRVLSLAGRSQRGLGRRPGSPAGSDARTVSWTAPAGTFTPATTYDYQYCARAAASSTVLCIGPSDGSPTDGGVAMGTGRFPWERIRWCCTSCPRRPRLR